MSQRVGPVPAGGLTRRAARSAAIVEKINRDIARAIALPDVREQLAALSTEPINCTSAEFARFVRGEIETAARVARVVGIVPQ